MRLPNLVASTISPRQPRLATAWPRYSSDRPSKYASAVSKYVTPASSADLTMASAVDASTSLPNGLQPSPMAEIRRPELPSRRYSTPAHATPLRRSRCVRQLEPQSGPRHDQVGLDAAAPRRAAQGTDQAVERGGVHAGCEF